MISCYESRFVNEKYSVRVQSGAIFQLFDALILKDKLLTSVLTASDFCPEKLGN